MDKTERGTMLKKCALIVVGAVLYAAGMGLFLSPNHLAPGGVTGIAVILNSAFGLPTGITAFVLNIPLFLIAIKAFGFRFFSATLAATTLMDVVLYGPDEAKQVYIVSDRESEIAEALLKLDVGITLLNGEGAFTGRTKKIILCVMRKSLYPAARDVVRRIDKNAFMIVSSANEVFGEGFKRHDSADL